MYLLDLAPWPRPEPNPKPEPVLPPDEFSELMENPEFFVIFGAFVLVGAAAFLIYKTCKK